MRVTWQVIRTAIADAELAPAEWTTLEMHGTGTALGDPIEMGAACAVASSGSIGIHSGVHLFRGLPTRPATMLDQVLVMHKHSLFTDTGLFLDSCEDPTQLISTGL